MDIRPVDVTGAAGAAGANEASGAPAGGTTSAVSAPELEKAMASSKSAHATSEKTEPSLKQIKQMVSEMQANLDSMNVNVQYSFYGKNDSRIAIKVVNKETGQVIREIPPKEMQKLHDKMDDLIGMIFNGKG